MFKNNSLIRRLSVAALVLSLAAFFVIAGKNDTTDLIKADIFDPDPIGNTLPCSMDNEFTLNVDDEPDAHKSLKTGSAAGMIRWKVAPSHHVLREPTNVGLSPNIFTASRTMGFVPNTSSYSEYTVTVHHDGIAAIPATTTTSAVPAVPFTSYTFPKIVLAPACITSVEFADPAGMVYSPDGTFKLNKIQVTRSDNTVKFYEGDDINQLFSSGLTFKLPSGVAYDGSTRTFMMDANHPEGDIVMQLKGPAAADSNLDSDGNCFGTPDTPVVTAGCITSNPLQIQASSCEDLQISILEGAGQGIDTSVTAAADAARPSVAKIDFSSNDSESILLQNKVSPSLPFGAATFEILFTFDETLTDKAKITSYVPTGNQYKITVRSELTASATADNFRYAVNELLTTPLFIAYMGTNSTEVLLQTLEVGEHTKFNSFSASVAGNSATATIQIDAFNGLGSAQDPAPANIVIGTNTIPVDVPAGADSEVLLTTIAHAVALDPNFSASVNVAVNNVTITYATSGVYTEAVDVSDLVLKINDAVDDASFIVSPFAGGTATTSAAATIQIDTFDGLTSAQDPASADIAIGANTISVDVSAGSDSDSLLNTITDAVNSSADFSASVDMATSTVTIARVALGAYTEAVDVSDLVLKINDAVDDASFTASPFAGGVDGVAATGLGYQCATVPLQSCMFGGGKNGTSSAVDPVNILEPVVNQLDSHLIYLKGGKSPIKWQTLQSDKIGIHSLFDDLAEEDLLGNDNIVFASKNISSGVTYLSSALTPGSTLLPTSKPSCKTDEASGDLISCDVVIALDLEYSPSFEFDIIINSTDHTVPPINGKIELTGDMTGFVSSEPLTIPANATITSTITTIGTLTGMVNGHAVGGVKANVSLNAEVALALDGQVVATFKSISATLVKDETLMPVNRHPNPADTVVSNFAVITAKRKGVSKIVVTDGAGCSASLPVTVRPLNLYVDFLNEEDSEKDSYKAGDKVQIKAWLGFDEENVVEDITTKVTWVLSDSEIASINNNLLTFKKEGILSLYATYVPDAAEVPPLVSNNLLLQTNYLTDLLISLGEDTLDKLPEAQYNDAYRSLVLAIHDPALAGNSLTIEEYSPNFDLTIPHSAGSLAATDSFKYYLDTDKDGTLDVDYSTLSDKQKVDLIADYLSTLDNYIDGVKSISKVPGYAGLITIESDALDSTSTDTVDNGRVDISTTAPDKTLSVFSNAVDQNFIINLPTSDTYQLMVLGKYSNQTTKRLSPEEVKWVSTHGFLDQGALDSGTLEFKTGEKTGVASIVAKIEEENVSSNSLKVEVTSGPAISRVDMDYVGSIQKGTPITFSIEVSDVDTIADVKDIRAIFYKSSADTYQEILNDPTRTKFGEKTYTDSLIKVSASQSQSDGSEDPNTETSSSDQPYYKTYDITFSIPQHAGLYDGDYKLVILFSDTLNHKSSRVIPVHVGTLSSGDVDADGKLSMRDVMYVYQIAIGKVTPTQSQKDAANIDGKGAVTMLDVLLLFRKITES